MSCLLLSTNIYSLNGASQTANALSVDNQYMTVDLVENIKIYNHIMSKASSKDDIRIIRKTRIILGIIAGVLLVVAVLPVSPIISGISLGLSTAILSAIFIDANGIHKDWKERQQKRQKERQEKRQQRKLLENK